MRPTRSTRSVATLGALTALTVTTGLVSSTQSAWADAPLAPKTSFTMVVSETDGTVPAPTDGEAIPNIDSVKSTIRAYYNATAGVANKTSSRYIDQLHQIEHRILTSLPATAPANAALTFDVDDTLLWNYDFEDSATNFNYDPALNTTYVTQHKFPAVPGMPQLLRQLQARGYRLFGITGRPQSQAADTAANLTEQGFTSDGTTTGTPMFAAIDYSGAGTGNLYTKGTVTTTGTAPAVVASIPTEPWVDCAADGTASSCSTVEVKALTRQHIAVANGVDIMMNVGDQWSDLAGGFADDWTKIPNPTYYLASPDLTTAPTSDDVMVPPTTYVMQADGSSGYSVASGDDIPNIDPLRKMIRAYYNAPAGTADKTSSPYISQMTSLTSTWSSQVSDDCTSKHTAYTSASEDKAKADAVVANATKAVALYTGFVTKHQQEVKNAKNAAAKKKAQQKLAQAKQQLALKRTWLANATKKDAAITVPPAPAVVFDADDTTLWNYDLEDGVMKFVYNPTTAATWVTGHLFPAVPGMVSVVQAAQSAGCAVFGLTGRPASQQDDTIANLTEDGYVDGSGNPLFTAARYFTKDVANQPWVDCGSDRTCSTIEYKAGTRQHIEDDLGFDVVGNFGDQYSDLIGDYADHTYKVPNPTYYLP